MTMENDDTGILVLSTENTFLKTQQNPKQD